MLQRKHSISNFLLNFINRYLFICREKANKCLQDKYCGSVNISAGWRAPRQQSQGTNLELFYSLFSILGSNCNLIILEGFFGWIYTLFMLQQYRKFLIFYSLAAPSGYFWLTFPLFFQKSKYPPVEPQLLGSFAKRLHTSSALAQGSGISSKENFEGGEKSDG